MDITDIKIRKLTHDEGRLRAIVSMTIDNSVAIHDIRLIQGDERLFVAMPSRRDDTGRYRDIIHPINTDIRNIIEQSIISEYNKCNDNPTL